MSYRYANGKALRFIKLFIVLHGSQKLFGSFFILKSTKCLQKQCLAATELNNYMTLFITTTNKAFTLKRDLFCHKNRVMVNETNLANCRMFCLLLFEKFTTTLFHVVCNFYLITCLS